MRYGVDFDGWAPVKFYDQHRRVAWMRFGEAGLREPFFEQSVRRLRTQRIVDIRHTDSDVLLDAEETVPPSGFIFHISRCGSTLLTNALREYPQNIVISEAHPISQALSFSAFGTDTRL